MKYLLKNIKVGGEVVDLLAQADAENVTYFAQTSEGIIEAKSVQEILSELEEDIIKLKKDVDQIEAGGSTVIQPIEYGGTGADNIIEANQNLKSAYLGSIPLDCESFSVVTLDNIDYSLPEGTYRYENTSIHPLITQLLIMPVDRDTGNRIADPLSYDVPMYRNVNVVFFGDSGAYMNVPDFNGDYLAFNYDLEVYLTVENYSFEDGFCIQVPVFAEPVQVDIPMYKSEGLTYSVSWYTETDVDSNLYELTELKIPNPEIRGGNGFEVGQTVSITESDKALSSEYAFDETNSQNVLTIDLDSDISNNCLALYFKKLPELSYTSYSVHMYDSDTGDEIEGTFTSEPNNGGIIIEYPSPRTYKLIGDTVVEEPQQMLFSDNRTYEYRSSDERNVTTLTLVKDSSQNVFKHYYKVPPLPTTYNINYVVEQWDDESASFFYTLIPISSNPVVLTGVVGQPVSRDEISSYKKQIAGWEPMSVRPSDIVLVKDSAENNFYILYPDAVLDMYPVAAQLSAQAETLKVTRDLVPVEGIVSEQLLQGKLFVSIQSQTDVEDIVLATQVFTGLVDIDGDSKYDILFRSFIAHKSEGVIRGETWTSLSQGGLVTTDSIEGILPIEKGGTGVSSVAEIGNALKVLALDNHGSIPIKFGQDIDSYKTPGVYSVDSNSTTLPEKENSIIIVFNTGDLYFPEQLCKIANSKSGSSDVFPRVYYRRWIMRYVSGVDQSGWTSWQLISMPNSPETLSNLKTNLFSNSFNASVFANNNNGTGVHVGSFNRKWFRFRSTNWGIGKSYSLLKLTAKASFSFHFEMGILLGANKTNSIKVSVKRAGSTATASNYYAPTNVGELREWTVGFYLNAGDVVELRHEVGSSQSSPEGFAYFFGFICANELCNIFMLYDFFDIETGSPNHGAGTSASPRIFPYTIEYLSEAQSVFDIDSNGNMVNQAYGFNTMYKITDNILINPYFITPVNQRNYPSTGANWTGNYFIDRWQFINNSAAGSVIPYLTGNGIEFIWYNAIGKFVWDLRQPLTIGQKHELFNKRKVLVYALVSWTLAAQSTAGNSNDYFYIQLANDTKSEYPGQNFYIINNENTNSLLYWAAITVPYHWEASDYIRFTFGAHFTQGHIQIKECGITSASCPLTPWQGEGTYLQELKKCYDTYQVHDVDLVGLRFSNGDTRCSVPIHPMRSTPTITWGGDLSFIEQTGKYVNYRLGVTRSVYKSKGPEVKIDTTDVFASDGVTKVTPSEILVFGTRNSVLTLDAEVH